METLYFSQIRAYFGTILSGFYGLMLYLAGPMDPKIEWIFAGILMFVIGIPHGAGDHLVVKKWREAQGMPFSIVRFMVMYLGVMVLYALLWYFLPALSFILFILISVFHFGDLEEKESGDDSFRSLLRKLSVGTGILGWILYFHDEEVKLIVGGAIGTLPAQVPNYLPFVFGACLMIGFRRSEIKRFSNTFLCLLIGCFLPVIPAFVCYFAGCHAVYSMQDMSLHLGIRTKNLLIKLLPFSCLAFLLGFLYLKYLGSTQAIFHSFVFLSLLTMPHFWLMHHFVKKK